jgi:hypothetical protein
VKTQRESYSFDPRGHMVTDWPVQKFRVQENWNCASMESLGVPKPKELK